MSDLLIDENGDLVIAPLEYERRMQRICMVALDTRRSLAEVAECFDSVEKGLDFGSLTLEGLEAVVRMRFAGADSSIWCDHINGWLTRGEQRGCTSAIGSTKSESAVLAYDRIRRHERDALR